MEYMFKLMMFTVTDETAFIQKLTESLFALLCSLYGQECRHRKEKAELD